MTEKESKHRALPQFPGEGTSQGLAGVKYSKSAQQNSADLWVTEPRGQHRLAESLRSMFPAGAPSVRASVTVGRVTV